MTVDDSRRSARRQAVILLYQRDVTGIELDELAETMIADRGADLDPYTTQIVAGVADVGDEVDAIIDGAASGWSVDRIAPLERNILRVAVYELTRRDDIPDAVSIDEAVGLAKRYCQADAGSFVNGILGAIVRREVHR